MAMIAMVLGISLGVGLGLIAGELFFRGCCWLFLKIVEAKP